MNTKEMTISLEASDEKNNLSTLGRGWLEGSFFNSYFTKEERYSIPWFAPLYPWSLPYNAEC